MKLGSVKYLTGEGVKNTWVNRLMSLASIGVLVACMVVIGLALLISENVNKALGNLEQQNVVMAYMKDYNWALYDDGAKPAASETASEKTETEKTDSEKEETKEEPDVNGIRPSDYAVHDDDEAKALCDRIAKLDNVAEVTFVTAADGLETAKSNMTEDQQKYFGFLDEEYGNPVSGAAKITMKDMSRFDSTLKKIESFDEISYTLSYSDLAEKISALKRGVTVAGIWIVAILVIISLVIVSNTIRITMYNRKLEISIMKAVGATDSFIRLPFVVEGVLIGVIAAVISEGLLYFCYRVATETIISTLQTTDIIRYGDMACWLLIIFLGIGILSGALGSFIMIGKYLRKEGSEFAAI